MSAMHAMQGKGSTADRKNLASLGGTGEAKVTGKRVSCEEGTEDKRKGGNTLIIMAQDLGGAGPPFNRPNYKSAMRPAHAYISRWFCDDFR